MKSECAQIDDEVFYAGNSSRTNFVECASNYFLDDILVAKDVTMDTWRASAHTNTLSGFEPIRATSSSLRCVPPPLLRRRHRVPSTLIGETTCRVAVQLGL